MTSYCQVVFPLPLDGSYTYQATASNLLFKRVKVRLKERLQIGLVIAEGNSPPAAIEFSGATKPLEAVLDETPLITTRELQFAQWLSRYYFSSLGEALALFLPFRKQFSFRLSKKELVEEEAATKKTLSFSSFPLAKQQARVAASFKEKLKGGGRRLYLHGVTASGKTYVYLELARQLLTQGRQVLVLVPEISLTWKMGRAFRALLGEREESSSFSSVALYHSQLTLRQRWLIRRRVQEGKVRVVVGTRSALFLPFPELGFIVVDEEHEKSYKSHSVPRYHLVQCAQYLAAKAEVSLLFGSATPSLVFYHHRKKQLHWQTLTQTYSGAAPPQLAIIEPSLAAQRWEEEYVDHRILKEIFMVLEQGRQVLVYLNRRGFSRSALCEECGAFPKCPNCEIPLTYHKKKQLLLCHYCAYAKLFYEVCLSCRSGRLRFPNFGVEKIFGMLKSKFCDYSVARFDSDELSTSKKLAATLAAFQAGEIAMLVGTSMIGKGHDFPRVSLVVVLHPERSLLLPDFRSKERFFQELLQVSGRAGRREFGRVLVQTHLKAYPTLEKILHGRTQEFYLEELEYRRKFLYPPFTRICRLVLRSKSAQRVKAAAVAVEEKLSLRLSKQLAQVLGPAPCFFVKQAGYFRWQLVFKIFQTGRFIAYLNTFKLYLRSFPQVYVEVDMEPTELF